MLTPVMLRGLRVKAIALSCCLAAFVWVAVGCTAQASAERQTQNAQPGDTQLLNQPVRSTMTCEEFKALVRAGDKRTIGLAILYGSTDTIRAVLGSANCPPLDPDRMLTEFSPRRPSGYS